MKTVIAVIMLGLLTACRPSAGVEPPKHQTLRLKNGLTVLLRPLSSGDKIALVTLFAVGEDHDPPSKSGLAHLVEHVYVTAAAGQTKVRTAQQFHQMYPDGANAQTGARYTVAASVFDPDRLQNELQDAADRLARLQITEADLEREKPRILTEVRNMFGGIPQLAAMNLSRELARPSPSGARKGGDPGQVRKLSLEDVQNHWRRYYKPVNTTLVLAGRFDPAEIRQQVEKLLGDLPTGEPAPAPRRIGKPQLGKTQEYTIKPIVPSAKPMVGLAIVAPPLTSEAYPAFLVMAARLQLAARKIPSDPAHFPVYYAPVDMPETLYVSSPVQDGTTPKHALEKLRRFVADETGRKLTSADRQMALNAFGFLLGLRNFPDAIAARNPYGIAFSLGRRVQMGVDVNQLARAIQNLKPGELAKCAENHFAEEKTASVVVKIAK